MIELEVAPEMGLNPEGIAPIEVLPVIESEEIAEPVPIEVMVIIQNLQTRKPRSAQDASVRRGNSSGASRNKPCQFGTA